AGASRRASARRSGRGSHGWGSRTPPPARAGSGLLCRPVSEVSVGTLFLYRCQIRELVLEHLVQYLVEQELRSLGHRGLDVPAALLPGRGDGAHRPLVMSDEVVRPQEDVELAGDELVGGRVEADAVDDDEDVALVVVHLRMVHL